MDKKAWIAVTLCILGLITNAYFATQNQAKLTAIKLAQAQTAAAQPAATTPEAQPEVAPKPVAPEIPEGASEQTHTIEQDGVVFLFTTLGGGVKTATIKGTRDEVVLNKFGKDAIGSLRPDAKVSDKVKYAIKEATAKKVVFEGRNDVGLLITKTYQLSEGEKSDKHLLNLTINFTNEGKAAVQSSTYFLYAGTAQSLTPDDIQHPSFFWNDAGDATQNDTNWFGSGWFSKNPMEFQQKFDRLRWGGVMSRFYANIISTKETVESQPGQIWAERLLIDHSHDEHKDNTAAKTDYAVQGAVGLPTLDIPVGAAKALEYEIYLGPKEYFRLNNIEHQRRFVMFYGMFSAVSRIFINMLNWLHSHVGNWGWAIVLLTITIRTVMWPLHAKSQRSMKRMGKLGPLMKELQEKYKDDQARLSQETMKLYKDYGVNPIGGCLPMFFQLPIFFGFFSMLGSAAELRGQPFLWAQDLSMPDTVMQILGFPLNPLPLLMGLTMFLQMKLTPQPSTVDKTQRMIFMFMPFMFLIFCYAYASALALYWTTQNIFSIAQSFIMKKMGDDDDGPLQKVARAPAGAPPSNSFASPGSKVKEKKPSAPRLGGGGTTSRTKK